MSDPSADGPPDDVRYELDEALGLLAALETARDALIVAGHFASVVIVETEIRVLNRKLRFNGWHGDDD